MRASFAILLFSSAVHLAIGQTAYAAQPKCTADAPYIGAPLRVPLDLSSVPNDRSISLKAMPKESTKKLDRTFDTLLESVPISAATVSIWKPGTGYWTRTKGIVDSGPDSFWWASTSKLATATVIIQLMSEGKLRPTDTVGSFFPEIEHGSSATVNDLLHHTSGIFSFNTDLRLRNLSGYKSPDALIEIADSHPLDFCSGTNWNYSNTGYVMLARIAEQIEGAPYSKIVERRIARPLELKSFRVLLQNDPETAMVPLAADDADKVAEIASIFGAGSIVATSPDMLSFLHAYLEGGLVSRSARNQAVRSLYPMFGTKMSYGTGIIVTDVPDIDTPTTWVGHFGGSPHAKGLLVYDMKRDAYIAIALNNQAPAEALANTLLKLLD